MNPEKICPECKNMMLPVEVYEPHGNGKSYLRIALVCSICGYTTKGEKPKKYPKEFKTHKASPGGIDFYR